MAKLFYCIRNKDSADDYVSALGAGVEPTDMGRDGELPTRAPDTYDDLRHGGLPG